VFSITFGVISGPGLILASVTIYTFITLGVFSVNRYWILVLVHPLVRTSTSSPLFLDILVTPNASLNCFFRFSNKLKMPTTLPAPSKPLNDGLDFSSRVYLPDEDSLEVFNRDSAEVLEWVRNNLPASIQFPVLVHPLMTDSTSQRFCGLQCLALLSLCRGPQRAAPIFIDARKSEVVLLDEAPTDAEPDVIANIAPQYVLDAITGRLLTQNMFSKHSVPPCPGAFASCFAPLGLPGPMTPSSELDHDSLPKPTEDPEQIKRDIKTWGYGLLANAITPEQVAILRTAVLEQGAGERKNGVAHMQGPNQRIW
jgi:hypothetical protein